MNGATETERTSFATKRFALGRPQLGEFRSVEDLQERVAKRRTTRLTIARRPNHKAGAGSAGVSPRRLGLCNFWNVARSKEDERLALHKSVWYSIICKNWLSASF